MKKGKDIYKQANRQKDGCMEATLWDFLLLACVGENIVHYSIYGQFTPYHSAIDTKLIHFN